MATGIRCKACSLIGIALLVLGGLSATAPSSAPAASSGKTPRRIISLAPSITEILFAVGAGDRVVGVTRFGKFPPEAESKTKVGGYLDPGYETILALKPDLVILLAEHEEARRRLSSLGVKLMAVNHKDIRGILDSITAIGGVVGKEAMAREITANITREMKEVESRTRGKIRPSVLIIINRERGAGLFREAYIAGKDGFYDKMIKMAGGRNAYGGELKFPVVTAEGVIRMNPEVIIEIVPEMKTNGLTPERILAEWKMFTDVKAVKSRRVHVLSGDYHVIPGPRFVMALKDLAKIFHPEEKWN